MVTISAACIRCRSSRRWRRVDDPDHIGCWTCWRCSPPPPGIVCDILNLVHGQPRILLAVPSEAVTDECFTRDLAEHGAPIALELRPLPCTCRRCRAA